MKKPIKVAITGAGGNIAYSLIFRILDGTMFGDEQLVDLRLIDIVPELLVAVMMEVEDCASPVLHDIECSSNPNDGFKDVDYALLVGAMPRKKGMERSDLLLQNAEIFQIQGRALNENANPNVYVLVVGNPANTNALITQSNAPDIPAANFSALLQLDYNRAVSILAKKLKCSINDVKQLIVWGNHSATQFPDLQHCKVAGNSAKELVDEQWRCKTFVKEVQQRGTTVIHARGASSAASAATAIVRHIKQWREGTAANDWMSMGILSDGSYGIQADIFFSYPVISKNHNIEIVPNLELDEFSKQMLKHTEAELVAEYKAIQHFLV